MRHQVLDRQLRTRRITTRRRYIAPPHWHRYGRYGFVDVPLVTEAITAVFCFTAGARGSGSCLTWRPFRHTEPASPRITMPFILFSIYPFSFLSANPCRLGPEFPSSFDYITPARIPFPSNGNLRLYLFYSKAHGLQTANRPIIISHTADCDG
jgi:hypothetical protein